MTPATSVLLLTTMTGFGYGLLAWVGVLVAFDALPQSEFFVPFAVIVALAFSAFGLMASTLHLGHPERAWRAFSQWRTSWLSREGVASLSTYPPALGLALSWWFYGPDALLTQTLGLLSAFLGLLTVACTAMIYACLKPIRQWNNSHTVPDYLIYGIFSGSVLLSCLWSLWFGPTPALYVIAALSAIIACVAKIAYWRFIDVQKPLTTLSSATGLSSLGDVRPLDRPHFTENYILREMGYRIARKHAAKLRRISLALAFLLPLALACLSFYGLLPRVSATAAVISALVGLFVERWLFFAEATHTSTIYYGR